MKGKKKTSLSIYDLILKDKMIMTNPFKNSIDN